jgi:hypothetical protein
VLASPDFRRSSAGHVLARKAGSDVAASATRVQTFCAVGWESPTGISDFWRFLAVNRAPPGVAPGDGGGSSVDPKAP